VHDGIVPTNPCSRRTSPLPGRTDRRLHPVPDPLRRSWSQSPAESLRNLEHPRQQNRPRIPHLCRSGPIRCSIPARCRSRARTRAGVDAAGSGRSPGCA
jgi:hypothetical protein